MDLHTDVIAEALGRGGHPDYYRLYKAGGSMDDVVQVNVYVRDMTGLEQIHEIRRRYFKPPYPTSTLVAVNGFVHPDALIEINAVAAIGAGSDR